MERNEGMLDVTYLGQFGEEAGLTFLIGRGWNHRIVRFPNMIGIIFSSRRIEKL